MAILDVVDTNDEVIGSASYEEINDKQLLHRSVCILLFDDEDRLYLQRRAKVHILDPGLWDMSATGHVDLGESYQAAAEREVEEELGLRDIKIKQITKYYNDEPNSVYGLLKGFVGLFVAYNNGHAVVPNVIEVMDGKWVTALELEELLAESPQEFTEGARTAYQKYKESK